MEETFLSSGELARRAGVNVQTLRYYERRGLLARPPRSPAGYRRYPASALRVLRFIKGAQALGFTLEEIEELLALRVDRNTTCREVRARAEAKLADIEAKLASLGQMRRALQRLADSCRGRGPATHCPILEALEAEEGH